MVRPTTYAAVAYVLTVAVLATSGVVSETPAPLLWAIALTLPTSVVTTVGYYLAYGFLALVPGANPPSGELATWFAVTTGLMAVLQVAVAASVNVVLLRLAVRRMRSRVPVDDDSPPVVPPC